MHIALNANVVGLAFKLVAGEPLFALNAGQNFPNSIPLSENCCSSYFFAIASSFESDNFFQLNSISVDALEKIWLVVRLSLCEGDCKVIKGSIPTSSTSCNALFSR